MKFHRKLATTITGALFEAYSQNPKDDSCDSVDCGLE